MIDKRYKLLMKPACLFASANFGN